MNLRGNTRESPVFGFGRELSQNELPTYCDVMKYFMYVSELHSAEKGLRDLVKNTSETVATAVEEIWKRASIPHILHHKIVAKIVSYHDKYRNLLKSDKRRSTNNKNYMVKLEKFKKDSNLLFDIATCKCKSFDICSCEKTRKIPIEEREFLLDQRGEKKMMIAETLDRKTTKKYLSRIQRQTIQTSQIAGNEKQLPKSRSSRVIEDHENLSSSFETAQNPGPSRFPFVARTLDRFGVSDRAGAAIVSATLQDIGLINDADTSKIVDRNKIRRERTKKRNEAVINVLGCDDSLICVSFDGRRDKTLVYEDNRRRVVVEEHISLVKEPGSKYIGHISLLSGNAKAIATKIVTYLAWKCNLHRIVALGCDGTNVNTGNKAGVISLIERKLNSPLQWFICQLHANELPLRHLFEALDGTTSGPKSFTGVIGKALKNCEHLPVVGFAAMPCELPDVSRSRSDLSTDQLYLYEMCGAISSGQCNVGLAKRNPGNIVHSRWLTAANRILRLYISTNTPSPNLLVLVQFIVKVYAPMWFAIKINPQCIYGAKHLHKTMQLLRYLPENLKKIVLPVIQRNGYFGHCENVLIAMLADERNHVKELALRRILKIRNSTSGLTTIRTFKLPIFNFGASDYIDMIDWKVVTEPPVVKQIGTDVISRAIQNLGLVESEILVHFRRMPCHTQATERCIKLVTESCSAVCGPERREGWVRNKLNSCRIMPIFNTKKEYKIQ